MKQQQASVIHAWQSVRQSDETIRHGRSIIVFTLATIIFVSLTTPSAQKVETANRTQLPLSFITSVFGMNTFEWSGDDDSHQPWHIEHQIRLLYKPIPSQLRRPKDSQPFRRFEISTPPPQSKCTQPITQSTPLRAWKFAESKVKLIQSTNSYHLDPFGTHQSILRLQRLGTYPNLVHLQKVYHKITRTDRNIRPLFQIQDG